MVNVKGKQPGKRNQVNKEKKTLVNENMVANHSHFSNKGIPTSSTTIIHIIVSQSNATKTQLHQL